MGSVRPSHAEIRVGPASTLEMPMTQVRILWPCRIWNRSEQHPTVQVRYFTSLEAEVCLFPEGEALCVIPRWTYDIEVLNGTILYVKIYSVLLTGDFTAFCETAQLEPKWQRHVGQQARGMESHTEKIPSYNTNRLALLQDNTRACHTHGMMVCDTTKSSSAFLLDRLLISWILNSHQKLLLL